MILPMLLSCLLIAATAYKPLKQCRPFYFSPENVGPYIGTDQLVEYASLIDQRYKSILDINSSSPVTKVERIDSSQGYVSGLVFQAQDQNDFYVYIKFGVAILDTRLQNITRWFDLLSESARLMYMCGTRYSPSSRISRKFATHSSVSMPQVIAMLRHNELPYDYLYRDHIVLQSTMYSDPTGVDAYNTCRQAMYNRRLEDCINAIDPSINPGLYQIFSETSRFMDCDCIDIQQV